MTDTGSAPWYKRAVFYEVLVRGFQDSGGDGTGDLRGLIDRLDYLRWLGVDCLWLLPIYQSPLRDGGYDIADYRAIMPEFGTLDDFRELVAQVHCRGMRLIIDLVMNHTSDRHPWFEESRLDPEGPYGDFYVWSDTDERYPDARVIFTDAETSNWAWDPVRQQFYWHRFFSHQPDLNYDNLAVQDAMLDIVDFWLDMGVDGFRLDAVPYLFEQEGTECCGVKLTHEFLKRLRRHVDARYDDRLLLAEANQWPSDVVDYFGDSDECHMAFHFPLMPRIFMAARREQRYPITEVLAQTPAIPASCQWGLFLRNHDELTLEMVTDEERDYMYAEYAADARMKANMGICRRLAPMLDNSRELLVLFNALLLSLPGSPVIYYGDEIGMGEDSYLGDRDGVRTPMQWSGDRNGGFSTADAAALYLPALLDPVYGYQAVNVASQQRTSTSLLKWMQTMLGVRREHPVFGLGSFEDAGGTNPSVFAFLREDDDELVLCVNNLSRFPQYTELDLARFAGRVPVELLGGVAFPTVGASPYLLTLGPHTFYWLRLT